MSNLEKNTRNPEREQNIESLSDAGIERYEELRKQHEKIDKLEYKNVHELQSEALNTARSIEYKDQESHHETSPAERRNRSHITRTERDISFNTTMNEVRDQMPAINRVFSQIIHNKIAEDVSDSLSSTIARPDALLSGAVLAFVLTLGVYLIAKNLGYPLSGFETIGAFVMGWIIGIVYDFLKVMITGRK